jgi:hypothetical protein
MAGNSTALLRCSAAASLFTTVSVTCTAVISGSDVQGGSSIATDKVGRITRSWPRQRSASELASQISLARAAARDRGASWSSSASASRWRPSAQSACARAAQRSSIRRPFGNLRRYSSSTLSASPARAECKSRVARARSSTSSASRSVGGAMCVRGPGEETTAGVTETVDEATCGVGVDAETLVATTGAMGDRAALAVFRSFLAASSNAPPIKTTPKMTFETNGQNARAGNAAASSCARKSL